MLFGKKNFPNEPYLHFDIERSNSFNDSFELWKNSKKYREVFHNIVELISQREEGSIDILDTETSKGYFFPLASVTKNPSDASFILVLMKERTEELGYICHLSDTRIYKNSAEVEQKDRYFLKPRFQYDEEKQTFAQGFGNVILELIHKNDSPQELKICIHTYRDRKYETAGNFDEYMELLLRD